jgi:hypothetical protein
MGWGQRPDFWSKTLKKQRNSEKCGLVKNQIRQSLNGEWPTARIKLALIPNETNKVRSHKNNPKYLEYNKVIHVGL